MTHEEKHAQVSVGCMWLCVQVVVCAWACVCMWLRVHVVMCAWGCVCVHVLHVCPSASSERRKKEEEKKRGQVFVPSCNSHPSAPLSKLVAHGNSLIMRSDGHPIIFTSQTSAQQRARRRSSQSVTRWISNKTRWPPNKYNKLEVIRQITRSKNCS